MKFNVIKRITKEDFEPKYQPLIEKLAGTLNQFIEQVVQGMNKNLTIEDNLPFEIKTFSVSVDVDGIPENTISFKTALKVRGIKVIRAENVQDTTTLSGAPFCQFTINTGIITITRIVGLPTSKKFSITLEITG